MAKTEKERAKELLQKERQTLFTILHNAPYGVALIDKDGKFLYINSEFTKITGYTVEDVIAGSTWFNTTSVFPRYRQEIMETWSRDVIQKGFERVFSVICQNREVKEIEFKPTLLEDGRIIVMLSDITERKRAEEALRESQRMLEALLNATTAAAFLIDTKGTILAANHTLAKALGKNVDELLGHSISNFLPPDVAKARREFASEVSRSGKPAHSEFEHQGIWLEESIYPVFDNQRKVSKLAIYSRDITDRKRTEEALRAASLIDELTGLSNRRRFVALAEHQLRIANRINGRLFLLFIDLDGLKQINDTHGHTEGDRALTDIAILLKETFRESDIIARIGGDEFAVLATEPSGGSTEIFTTRLQENVKAHNARESRPYELSVSIGVTQFGPESSFSVAEMLAQADALMYEHKRSKQQYIQKSFTFDRPGIRSPGNG